MLSMKKQVIPGFMFLRDAKVENTIELGATSLQCTAVDDGGGGAQRVQSCKALVIFQT